MPEIILIGITSALAQSLWHVQKRPTFVQIAFNIANLTLTIGACHSLAEHLFALGFEIYRPAVMVSVTAMYFIVNTVLVSTVLSLFLGKPLLEIQRQWYLWSFPYYLVGAAIAGLLPFGKITRTPRRGCW